MDWNGHNDFYPGWMNCDDCGRYRYCINDQSESPITKDWTQYKICKPCKWIRREQRDQNS